MALPEVGWPWPLAVQSCGPQIGGEEELRELYLAPPPPCMGPPNYPAQQGPRAAHRGGHQAHRGQHGEGGHHHHHRSKSARGG